MASYSPTAYATPNGPRALNLPYQGVPIAPAAQARPSGGLLPPGIIFKPSPFYEAKYQVGEIKVLEGECEIALLSPLC